MDIYNTILTLRQMVLDESIECMGLSTRAKHSLERAGITTIRDLTKCSEAYTLLLRDFGKKTRDEVRGKLRAIGFDFGSEEEDPYLQKFYERYYGK